MIKTRIDFLPILFPESMTETSFKLI